MKPFLLLFLILSSLHGIAQRKLFPHPKESKQLQAYINSDTMLIVTNKENKNQILQVSINPDGWNEYSPGLVDDLSTPSFREIQFRIYPYFFYDVNFDGYDDLLYPPSNPDSFQGVYIFNPEKQTLEYNKELSSIPCIYIQQKTKTIEGRCFDISLVEHWWEKYKWNKGKLLLIEKKGVMPSKEKGYYYEYLQKRVNGKMKFIYKKKAEPMITSEKPLSWILREDGYWILK